MAQALPADAAIPLPTAAQQQRLILTALAQRGCGRRKLIGLLRGDAELAEEAQNTNTFGQLSFRSENALNKMIDLLIADNLVVAKTLSHGGVVLDITPHGRQQLRTDTGMQQRIRA